MIIIGAFFALRYRLLPASPHFGFQTHLEKYICGARCHLILNKVYASFPCISPSTLPCVIIQVDARCHMFIELKDSGYTCNTLNLFKLLCF
ncbi:hypothetical protein Hanom_Chr06g00553581 [Helianthus anomalus]